VATWGARRDKEMRALAEQTGKGRMSGRHNDGYRKPCPQCNGGRKIVPKALRTTSVRYGSDNGCGNCGGDGYLDPGDKGY
jgi:hypothetical protein